MALPLRVISYCLGKTTVYLLLNPLPLRSTEALRNSRFAHRGIFDTAQSPPSSVHPSSLHKKCGTKPTQASSSHTSLWRTDFLNLTPPATFQSHPKQHVKTNAQMLLSFLNHRQLKPQQHMSWDPHQQKIKMCFIPKIYNKNNSIKCSNMPYSSEKILHYMQLQFEYKCNLPSHPRELWSMNIPLSTHSVILKAWVPTLTEFVWKALIDHRLKPMF